MTQTWRCPEDGSKPFRTQTCTSTQLVKIKKYSTWAHLGSHCWKLRFNLLKAAHVLRPRKNSTCDACQVLDRLPWDVTLLRFHLQHGLQVPWLWPSGALCLWPSAQQKRFRAAARPMLAKHLLRRSCLSESRAETKFRTHHKQRGNYISIVHLDY